MHTQVVFPVTLALSAVALATPLTLSTRAESWPISELEVHFMGRDSGLPGSEWPEAYKFNSTLDFKISFPSVADEVSCHGSWKYQEVPTMLISCNVEGVEFQLSPTSSGVLTEASFVLTVRKKASDATTGADSTLSGTQEILSNGPGKPNSYLSCLGGVPLDGIRCKDKGWASTAGAFVLNAQ